MSRQRRGPIVVGSISEDTRMLAEKVHAELAYGDRMVWACEKGLVYAGTPDAGRSISTHNMAGTFRLGQPFDALVEDLDCLRESMSKYWIFEEGLSPVQRVHVATQRPQPDRRWS